MDAILDQGIEITIWIQSLGTWFLPVMSFFSLLGSEPFFLFLAPTIYWCLDPILGIRAGLFLLINSGVNSVLKILFHSPRPYWYSEDVKAYSAESSFGLPSGHAQTSVVVWGTIAQYVRRWWVWILAILTMLFIGLSRIYLGVHFPSDVLFGWLIGIVILWLLIRLESPFLSWFNEHHWTFQIILVFIASLSFVGLFTLIISTGREDNLPQAWIDTAALAAPGEEPIDPFSISSIISYAGAFLGMAVGAIWMKSRGWFSTKDPIWHLLLRYLIGLFGVAIIYSGLGALLPRGDDLVSQILRYLRYALVGVWITGGAPEMFIRLRLAKPLK
jgi:membrane-associated phospholipid phosphatase